MLSNTKTKRGLMQSFLSNEQTKNPNRLQKAIASESMEILYNSVPKE